MLTGCGLLATSMLTMPYCIDTTTQLIPLALLPLALGSTMMSATPNALIADVTSTETRAQALSLLRTAGDLGLLAGATCSGVLASVYSIETALQCNGVITSAALLWFAGRNWHRIKRSM